jgi:hypothetical protein
MHARYMTPCPIEIGHNFAHNLPRFLPPESGGSPGSQLSLLPHVSRSQMFCLPTVPRCFPHRIAAEFVLRASTCRWPAYYATAALTNRWCSLQTAFGIRGWPPSTGPDSRLEYWEKGRGSCRNPPPAASVWAYWLVSFCGNLPGSWRH